MSSTKERVLQTLLTRPRQTINELAENVGINPISVRHHISNLMAEGLILSEEVIHGVGRPRRVYYLTEAGFEKFPTRYVRLTIRLLEQLKETMPAPIVNQLFSKIAEELANEFASSKGFQEMSLEERLNSMKHWLAQEGFQIEWEKRGDQYHIVETSCPYYHVGQDHPEICAVDQILISSVLSTTASKIKCILNGDQNCLYVIDAPTQEKEA
jgi:DeoR family suf operon transcriptional repressor